MTFRHALKLLLRRVPGFAGMFQRREQLREQARTIEAIRAALEQAGEERKRAEEEKWQAIRERERADAAKWQAVREREESDNARGRLTRQLEDAERARWQAVREREESDNARGQLTRQLEDAERARWQAVREREESDNARGQLTRQLEDAERTRWQAVREREESDNARGQLTRQLEEAERARLQAVREGQEAETARLGTASERLEARVRGAESAAARHLQWKDVPHLEQRGLFVFGQTRSGTTVLTRALNTSPDIMLLSEANIYVEGMRTGFARWFNDAHRQLGGTYTKGTYCPIAPKEDSNGPETLDWISKRFRYVGDKIAFRGEKLGYDPEGLFAFHARHFFRSDYVCVIRNPADVMKSNQEMFKPRDLWLYADSYLQALLLILAFAETLPNVYVLFHESITQRTFDVLGKELKVDLGGVYEANYGRQYQVTELRGTDHTTLPWLTILGTAHQMMRDAFSPETLREMPNHPAWMMLAPWIREMRQKLLTTEPKHLRVASPLNDNAIPLAR